MFKKGDYIVTLICTNISSCAQRNYVFKQKEDRDFINPEIDLAGSTTNYNSNLQFHKQNEMLTDWRYATEQEKREYDRIGKPYNTSTLVKELPTDFAIKRTDSSALWYKYIDWLNNKFGHRFDGFSECFYGIEKNTPICRSRLGDNIKIITLSEWDNIVNNTKTQEMNKEIIGYKLKSDCKQYAKAACQIEGYQGMGEVIATGEPVLLDKDYKIRAIEKLRAAKVLDLWFEPVYEQPFKVGDWVIGWHVDFKDFKTKAWKIYNISKKSINYIQPDSSYGTNKQNIRLATEQEIKAAQEQVVSVGGQFNVTIRNGQVYHKNDNITDFVERLVAWGNSGLKVKAFGSYNATISDITFSATGCQDKTTKLSDWQKVYNLIH